MQGANAVLNVLTIPPGASITSPRLVLDGVRGAVFVYTSGGPVGALIGSWSGQAGTDPYGNTYPAGLNVGGFTSGAQIYVQATTPTGTIPLNSLWINTTNGAAETWNGTTWVVATFNAANLLQSQTITAGLLIAGIVVAGIVNGTTITGSTIIDTGGGYFGYNGTPAAGNLFYSDTDTSGTDANGNAYLKGVSFYGNPSSGVWIAVNMSVANSAYGPQYYTATSSAGPWSLDSFVSRSSSNAGQLEIGPIVELPSTSLLPATPAAGGKLWTPTATNTPRIMKIDGVGYPLGENVQVLSSNVVINSTSNITIFSQAVNNGTQYYFEGICRAVQGTVSAAQKFGFTSPSTIQCCWFWASNGASGLTGIAVVGAFNSNQSFSPPGGASSEDELIFWGSFTPNASGTFSMYGLEGTSGDSWTAEAGSFIKIRTTK